MTYDAEGNTIEDSNHCKMTSKITVKEYDPVTKSPGLVIEISGEKITAVPEWVKELINSFEEEHLK